MENKSATGKTKLNHQFCELLKEQLNFCYKKTKTPEDAWRLICLMMGGAIFRVPTISESKTEKIIKGIKRGLTNKQIIEIYGVSETWVKEVKKRYNKNNKE